MVTKFVKLFEAMAGVIAMLVILVVVVGVFFR